MGERQDLPGTGELAIIRVIAAFAILVGILLVAFGLRLRSWHSGIDRE